MTGIASEDGEIDEVCGSAGTGNSIGTVVIDGTRRVVGTIGGWGGDVCQGDLELIPMTGNGGDGAEGCLGQGFRTSVVFTDGPGIGGNRNKAEGFEGIAGVVVQSTGIGIDNTELDLVAADRVVGFDHGRQDNDGYVGRKIPTIDLVNGRGVAVLKDADTAGKCHTGIGAFLKAVVTGVGAAGIVPQTEFGG